MHLVNIVQTNEKQSAGLFASVPHIQAAIDLKRAQTLEIKS